MAAGLRSPILYLVMVPHDRQSGRFACLAPQCDSSADRFGSGRDRRIATAAFRPYRRGAIDHFGHNLFLACSSTTADEPSPYFYGDNLAGFLEQLAVGNDRFIHFAGPRYAVAQRSIFGIQSICGGLGLLWLSCWFNTRIALGNRQSVVGTVDASVTISL